MERENMYDSDYEFDPETDTALNELMSLLGNIPKNTVTMLNMPRYMQAIVSVDKIVKLIKDDCPSAKITVEFDELTGTSLCLRIIADEFNVYRIGEFCKAIESADTMDVIPRLDEKLEIGFTYKQVKFPVPPTSN
jgi:hypothetical protein